ncbi:hypothetical protein ACP4OV_021687 [Aristida adscensionis]
MCSNHVEEGTELNVCVDGLSLQDKRGTILKANKDGVIDLSGALKVVCGFGSQASLTISHHKKKIFSKIFQIAIRELKAIDVPESCPAGFVLENIMFEVSDSDGIVDESIDGPLHTLIITLRTTYHYWKAHNMHLNMEGLRTTLELHVYGLDFVLSNMDDGPESYLSCPISSIPDSNLLLHSQLAPEHSHKMAECIKDVIEETTDEIGDTHSKLNSERNLIEALYSRKKSLEDEIAILKDEVGPVVRSFITAKELTREKLIENIGTAASTLCSVSNGECLIDDVVGIVALLGTVTDNRISRMLAVYLGMDDMLAVVCKTQSAANKIEKYGMDGSVDFDSGIYHEAAALGVPIKKRFVVICLDVIKPYKGGLLWNSIQKELAFTCPFPHLNKKPDGFCGFAVNMINLSDEDLNITTGRGYGLRERCCKPCHI